ncbi:MULTISPECIES: transposase [Acidiphilium]|jgi:transposase|uniref:transposase n=1 Tax=Acidiphilium TaxID=522 RepID=UPI0009D9E23B|nr:MULTISPECIES: transposase [Acidiphilium]
MSRVRIAAVLLTPGQVSDISGARSLLPTMPPPEDLIADKAYDADDLRAFLTRQGTRLVISTMPNRRAIPAFDSVAYRLGNLIECAFCRLKDRRAIVTR